MLVDHWIQGKAEQAIYKSMGPIWPAASLNL